MAGSATKSITAPSPDVPLVGIVAVRLPDDGPAYRSTWLDQDTLIVGYDPRWLTRELTVMVVRRQVGEFTDLDAEVTL